MEDSSSSIGMTVQHLIEVFKDRIISSALLLFHAILIILLAVEPFRYVRAVNVNEYLSDKKKCAPPSCSLKRG